MGTVVLLTIASVSGMVIGIGILRGRHLMGVMASQGLVVVAVSFLWTALHTACANHIAVSIRDLIRAAAFRRRVS